MEADLKISQKIAYNNMKKKQVHANPRTLQHIALGAVVVFSLVISYAIHLTNETVAAVKDNRYRGIYENQTIDNLDDLDNI
jgi:hypothetical protein